MNDLDEEELVEHEASTKIDRRFRFALRGEIKMIVSDLDLRQGNELDFVSIGISTDGRKEADVDETGGVFDLALVVADVRPSLYLLVFFQQVLTRTIQVTTQLRLRLDVSVFENPQKTSILSFC
jgi:hypothetical protein